MYSGVLFDFDDTLVETTVYFNHAKDRFAKIMAGMGFSTDEVLDTLNQYDIKNVQLYGGFLKECFPRALGDTYEYYCKTSGWDYSSALRREIEGLGWWVFDQPAKPVQGAEEVLERLYNRFPLFLTTKGDPEVQNNRVEESGLSRWFNKVYILADKNVIAYRNIALEQQIRPLASWVVGNSMKSDINPALKAGFKSIYVHHPHTWDYEDEEPVGGHISVDSIIDVLKVVDNKAVLDR